MATKAAKYVYFFGHDENTGENLTEGNMGMKVLLGGKGANLAEMAGMNLSVPQGFTIVTEACAIYEALNKSHPENACAQCKKDYGVSITEPLFKGIEANIAKLESAIGAKFAAPEEGVPMFLLSVRSGAAVSMPGMMDTILNVGLNDELVEQFAKQTGNQRLAYDSYRRLLQMFSDVVLRLDRSHFEAILNQYKTKRAVKFDSELNVEELKSLIGDYKLVIKQVLPSGFPQHPRQQLYMAIEAVLKSWNNTRAIDYRRLNHITDLRGTAVNVQRMVFGNGNDQSGTGVAFSRNPSTGENKLWGEFLLNAQGEDVVAGIRNASEIHLLKDVFPHCFDQLATFTKLLEQKYKDVQDMEFTIQDRKLFMLQTRVGKTNAQAAVKMYVDMVEENLITEKQALLRVAPHSLQQLLHKQFIVEEKKKHKLLATGLATSPGAAVGKITFNSKRALELSDAGDTVLLVRRDTEAEDLIGIAKAQGILTSTGGQTSHAAVVARGMGKTCVSGCQAAKIDEHAHTLTFGDEVFREGDILSLDGDLGEVYKGAIGTTKPQMSESFHKFMGWERKYRKLGVRVNADTPGDVQQGLEFGCEGLGLCRTEHMFFEKKKLKIMREVIMASTVEMRREALAKLKPYQRKDFLEMLKIAKDKPFTVRLLDPPLHEFLPVAENDAGIADVARDLNLSEKTVLERVLELHEFNPMIGKRGCRVGVQYPEITQMQAEAFFEAVLEVYSTMNVMVQPEVMVPLITTVNELIHQKAVVDAAAKKILTGTPIEVRIGCMIETPRAVLTADKIAHVAQFFSFGSNDLTQTTFGFSRDDVSKFMPLYLENNILPHDPFTVLDEEGVAQLIKMAIERGRSVNPNLEIGLCGEHGGDPRSIHTLSRIGGLDYVSCSPYRILTARLAACQAALQQQ